LKRGLLFFGIAVMILGVLAVPQAALAGSVGYVDFEFLFNAHPEYESKNGELQRLAEQMTEQFQEQVENLETEEEVENLARQYEAQLDEYAEQLRVSIIASVQEFIGRLADREGISVVLPDSTIIYGGVNLTPLVLEFMYESYGISVPSNLQQYL